MENGAGLLLSLTTKSSLFQRSHRSKNSSKNQKLFYFHRRFQKSFFYARQTGTEQWMMHGPFYFNTLLVSWSQKLPVQPPLQVKFRPSQGWVRAPRAFWCSMSGTQYVQQSHCNTSPVGKQQQAGTASTLLWALAASPFGHKKLGRWSNIDLCVSKTEVREWRNIGLTYS